MTPKISRETLELAKTLSDHKWHTTTALAFMVGNYIKPERAFRRTHKTVTQGRRKIVNDKLQVWHRSGRVEKRQNGKYTEWHILKTDWLVPYLSALIDILKEQKL